MDISILKNELKTTGLKAFAYASLGYLGLRVLTNLNPYVGVVFGTTYALSTRFVDPFILKKFPNINSNLLFAAKVVTCALIALKGIGQALSFHAVFGVITGISLNTVLLGTCTFLMIMMGLVSVLIAVYA